VVYKKPPFSLFLTRLPAKADQEGKATTLPHLRILLLLWILVPIIVVTFALKNTDHNSVLYNAAAF
jgi:hypothetical protein